MAVWLITHSSLRKTFVAFKINHSNFSFPFLLAACPSSLSRLLCLSVETGSHWLDPNFFRSGTLSCFLSCALHNLAQFSQPSHSVAWVFKPRNFLSYPCCAWEPTVINYSSRWYKDLHTRTKCWFRRKYWCRFSHICCHYSLEICPSVEKSRTLLGATIIPSLVYTIG